MECLHLFFYLYEMQAPRCRDHVWRLCKPHSSLVRIVVSRRESYTKCLCLRQGNCFRLTPERGVRRNETAAFGSLKPWDSRISTVELYSLLYGNTFASIYNKGCVMVEGVVK
jgi:hypothetical protein